MEMEIRTGRDYLETDRFSNLLCSCKPGLVTILLTTGLFIFKMYF
jgi:hypothetical protein